MPARSNLFQRVIFLVQKQLAQGSTVTESAMLKDSSTGELREVDIYIEGELPGVPVPLRISIECRDHKSKQDVTWVEGAKSKHEHLPTDVLILASSSGFTSQASTKAEHLKVTLWEPRAPDEDVSREIVGRLSSLRVKQLSYRSEEMRFHVTLEDLNGQPVDDSILASALSDELVDLDGNPLGSIHAVIQHAIFSSQGNDFLRDAMDGEPTLNVSIPNFKLTRAADGTQVSAYIYPTAQPEQRMRIKSLEANVKAKLVVNEVPLTHRQLPDAPYSYGRVDLQSEDMIVLVTEPSGTAPEVFVAPYAPPKNKA